ncbi:MAG: hypothetical protein JW940_11120 [Polyangiaceae bacterium]|nr:hypothetical protein [Polyangiaceae bacterium]
MDVGTLMDAIVGQTTVLVAQLATAGGGRPQLAHTANQVFLDLVDSRRGHPYHGEATGLSAEFRTRGSRLREAIAEYSTTHSAAEEDTVRVVSYAGQNVIGLGSTREDAHD